MLDLLFYIFASMPVVPAFLMVTSRSPVTAAMFMIASLVGMACLFVMMDAFFLAILQVLVYAGAVMVLFLFIIMLLDLDEGEDLRSRAIPSMAAMVLGGLVTIFGFFSGKFDDQFPESQEPAALKLDGSQTLPEVYEKHLPLPYSTKAKTFGYGLFTKYMLPFQVTGVLLLIAMVGVIVLSKRTTDESEGGSAT